MRTEGETQGARKRGRERSGEQEKLRGRERESESERENRERETDGGEDPESEPVKPDGPRRTGAETRLSGKTQTRSSMGHRR
jgi:hypothetical protein